MDEMVWFSPRLDHAWTMGGGIDLGSPRLIVADSCAHRHRDHVVVRARYEIPFPCPRRIEKLRCACEKPVSIPTMMRPFLFAAFALTASAVHAEGTMSPRRDLGLEMRVSDDIASDGTNLAQLGVALDVEIVGDQ